MIAMVRGEVIGLGDSSVVIQVSGIGLQVHAPTPLVSGLRMHDSISLHTHLIVREDLLALYGFETPQERDFFVLLLGVNGIGPRSALAILSVLSLDAIRRAVTAEQVDVFCRVPGIGRKTAQKILLHLQGKIDEGELSTLAGMVDVDGSVIDALTSLGYSIVEAQAALQSISKDAPKDTEERLRLALRYFST